MAVRNVFESIVIATLDCDGAVVKRGEESWDHSDTREAFNAITRDRICIAGAWTAQKFGPVPKGGRWIVVTHDKGHVRDFQDNGWVVTMNFKEAIRIANKFASMRQSRPLPGRRKPAVCMIGGKEIYTKAVPHASYIYEIHARALVSSVFHKLPVIDPDEWTTRVSPVHNGSVDWQLVARTRKNLPTIPATV